MAETTVGVTQKMPNVAAREDRLRRFSPTPFTAALRVMGRTLALETDSAKLLRQARKAFEPYGVGSPDQSEFRWRVVTETGQPDLGTWPEVSALSSDSLRLVHFGPCSFIAVDLEACEAVGSISENLVADDSAFCSIFLASLFQATAEALRLTPLSAACLALGEKCLLLLGPVQHGRSAASHLAAKLGLEFHSDQIAFIEIEGNSPRVWGQFWNSLPQPDVLPRRSEITTAPRTHNGAVEALTVSDQLALRPVATPSLTPVLCIFLEPVSSEVPRLSPLHDRESLRRLREEGLAGAAGPCNRDRDRVAHALSTLPAYRLTFGRDPGAAAVFLRSMLRTHDLLEAQS